MKINDMPEDLVTDILSRLPVKSLIRFAGVCSSWLDLIRNPDFIKSHHLKQTSLNDNNFRVFVKHDYNYLSLLTKVEDEQEGAFDYLESVRTPFGLVVMGHCTGLLCLRDQWENIFIWNPATREVKPLPFLSHIKRPIFTKSTSFRNFGFGFDHKTGDYKVLVLMSADDVFSVDIFNVQWSLPFDEASFLWTGAVGAIDKIILSFDFGNEVFKEIMLPDFGDSVGDYSLTLAMFNGLLAVIRCTHEGVGKFFDILTINEHGEKESWVKQVSVGPILGIERPLGFWINGDLCLVDAEQRLVLFDTRDEKVVKLERHGSTGIMEVVSYVESLVPINGRLEDADGQFTRINPWYFFPGLSSSDEEEEEEEEEEDLEREASGSP